MGQIEREALSRDYWRDQQQGATLLARQRSV
jgi:hypothetical protein